MPSPLRVAILECDEPIGEAKRKYGSFGNLFHLLFAAGVSRLQKDSYKEGLEIIQSSYDVRLARSYPPLDEIDAVVLTGSSKSNLRKFDYNKFR